MLFRNAEKSDAAQLVPLLAQLGDRYQMSVENMQDRIAAFDRQDHQIIVAEQEKLIMGAIAFGCYEQFRLQGRCCHIDTLIIDKNYRTKGLGKQLIALAEQYAAAHGAIVIELTTANHRRKGGTHAFYGSLGYKDHLALDCSYFSKE